jgi:hypothetical protein
MEEGRPEDLGEEGRDELARADELLGEERLASVFSLFGKLRPPREPRRAPTAYPDADQPPLGAGQLVEGWRWVFLERLSVAMQTHGRMRQELLVATPATAPGGPLPEGVVRAVSMGRREPLAYLRFLAGEPGPRVRLHDWLWPLAEQVRGFVYAAARAQRAPGGPDRGTLLDAVEYVGLVKAAFYGHLENLPLPLLVGRQPRTPEEALLVAKLEWHRANAASHLLDEVPSREKRHWAVAIENYRRALEISASDDLGAEARAYAYGNLFEVLVDRGRIEEAHEVLARWRSRERELPVGAQRRFHHNILSIFAGSEGRWPLSAEILRWVVEESRMRFRPEEFPDFEWERVERAEAWLEENSQ